MLPSRRASTRRGRRALSHTCRRGRLTARAAAGCRSLSLSLSLARLAAPTGKQYSVVVKAQNKATGETTSSDVATVTCDASEKAKALADQMRAQLEQQASEQEARKGAASSKLEARLAKRKAAAAKAAA